VSDLIVESLRFLPEPLESAIGVSVPKALDWSGEVFFMVFGRGFGLRAGFMIEQIRNTAKLLGKDSDLI